MTTEDVQRSETAPDASRSADALRDFRLRLAQQRRQGWQIVEHDEERLHALLYKEESRERGVGGRPARRTAVRRSWQRLWVDERGRLRSGPADPPSDDAVAEPGEPAAETSS